MRSLKEATPESFLCPWSTSTVPCTVSLVEGPSILFMLLASCRREMETDREAQLVCTSGVHGFLAFFMFLGCNWISPGVGGGDGIMPANPPNASVHLGCHNKLPQTEWLQHQKFIFSPSGGCKSKIRVLAGLTSSEASFLGLQLATLLTVSSQGLSPAQAHPCVSASLLEDSDLIALGLTLMTLFKLTS